MFHKKSQNEATNLCLSVLYRLLRSGLVTFTRAKTELGWWFDAVVVVVVFFLGGGGNVYHVGAVFGASCTEFPLRLVCQ